MGGSSGINPGFTVFSCFVNWIPTKSGFGEPRLTSENILLGKANRRLFVLFSQNKYIVTIGRREFFRFPFMSIVIIVSSSSG